MAFLPSYHTCLLPAEYTPTQVPCILDHFLPSVCAAAEHTVTSMLTPFLGLVDAQL